MPRSRLASLVVLIALLVLGCGSARLPRPARSFDDRPEGVVVDYPNGLRLVVAPDLSGDLVRVHMRVRAGSRNEGKDQAGLAHFAEHVVLCALPLPDGRTVCDALAEETLDYRATTDSDAVTFSATTVAAHLPTVLGLFAFVLGGTCDVSPEQFARERNVVLSELQQRMGASLDAFHELLAAVYPPTHPYAHFEGGTRDSLMKMTADDVCGYARDRFTPGNAALVVTGGVTHEQVVRAAEATLRPLAARRTSQQVAAPTVTARGARRTLAGLLSVPGTALVFPLPPRHSDDGWLAQILVDMVERAVADEAPAFGGIDTFDVHLLGGTDAPMLALFAGAERLESRAATEALLWRAIDTVQSDARRRDNFEALRRRLRLDTARRFERLDARAERYLDLEPRARRGALASDLRRIDALTSAALARAARDLLARERAWVFDLTPSRTADGVVLRDVTRLPDDAHTVSASPQIVARLLAEIPAANRHTRYTLANGLTVVLAPSSSPLLDVRLIVDAGIVDAPEEQFLAPIAATLLRPAEGTPADKDLQRLFATGATVDISVGPDVTLFRTRGLATDTDHLLRGLGGIVVDGRYAAGSRAWIEDQVRQTFAADLQAEPRRRRAARGMLDRCDELDVTAPADFGMRELDEFRRKHYRAGAATLIVAGGFDEAVARAHVDDVLGRAAGPWGQPAPPSSLAPTRPSPALRSGVYQIESSQSSQVHVLLGFVVPPELRRDRATVLLLRQLLVNATDEVRERLGVSYGFAVTLDNLCGAQMLLLDGQIDAAHLAAGVGELRRAFAGLRTPEGVAAALAAAQRPVAGRLLAEAADSQVLADRLAFVVEHGLPLDYFRSEARRVLEIQPQRLADVFTESLAPDRLLAVCAGPPGLTGPCDELRAP